MAFFKKPLLRVPVCTFACGFATAAFQLVIALLLGADSFVFSDFYALALPLLPAADGMPMDILLP